MIVSLLLLACAEPELYPWGFSFTSSCEADVVYFEAVTDGPVDRVAYGHTSDSVVLGELTEVSDGVWESSLTPEACADFDPCDWFARAWTEDGRVGSYDLHDAGACG